MEADDDLSTMEDDAELSVTRLKFMRALILDESVDISAADDAENDSALIADVETVGNALSISMSNESHKLQNAVAIGEMDLAIAGLQRWREQQRREEKEGEDDVGGGRGEEGVMASEAILQALRSELSAMGGEEEAKEGGGRPTSSGGTTGSSSSTTGSSSSGVRREKTGLLDLSLLERQGARVERLRGEDSSASIASATAATNDDGTALPPPPASDKTSLSSSTSATDAFAALSPEQRRLLLLEQDCREGALRAHATSDLERSLQLEEEQRAGEFARLAAALADYDADFDSLLA